MKIIACDYDGTLFREDGSGVSLEDKNAIIQFRNNGGLFGIVTGRDLINSSYVIKELDGIFDFLICSTGAITCNNKGEILSEEKSYAISAISKIADFSLSHNLRSFNVICRDIRYPLDISGKIKHNYSNLEYFNNCTIWFEKIEDAELVEKYIKDNHSNELTFFRNFECIEITPIGVNKSTAVKAFSSQYNDATVYAVGDGATDVPMVRDFYGFALENSIACVKMVAKHECKRVCNMIDIILK